MTHLPSEPDRSESTLEDKAFHLSAELARLSEEILSHSTESPELPVLSQLILRRGAVLEEVKALPLEQLPAPIRKDLGDKLALCQTFDQTISEKLSVYRNSLKEQLRGSKDTQALLNKYRVGGSEDWSRRSEKA